MYLELFKLHELPFRLTPDPQFLYLSKHHARAKAYMESYRLAQRKCRFRLGNQPAS